MTWQAVYQRSLNDLLEAERARRQAIEADRARLVQLLTGLAQRHDGQRLEELRRQDPGTPEHWSADEWTAFFANQTADTLSWGANGNGRGDNGRRKIEPLHQAREQECGGEREIKHDFQSLDSPVIQAPLHHTTPAPMLPSTQSPQHPVSLSAFTPPNPPLKFKGLLSNHGLSGLRWRRGAMMLYLMASRGINAHLEMDFFVAEREGLSYRTNSTKKPLENLAAAGLVIAETLRMEVGDFRTALKLARLTDEGRLLCQALDWPVAESDWERLIRLHQGLRQTQHTLAVLYFAILARVRGWTTEVMPEVEGGAAPDILVAKGDERCYVEVELGARGSEKQTAKWKHLADLQGKVALCAPNVKIRERLVADCRLAKLSGVATDLATLVAKPYHEAQAEPLWFKDW